MITQAFDYKIWADERTLCAIDEMDSSCSIDSYSFALQQVNHMVIVEDLFKSRLIGEPAPHESTNTLLVPKFEELKNRLLASGRWYLDYASKLSTEKRQDIISFTFADSKRGTMSIEEILFHVVNHGSYHRGSIAHALDLAGVPHPPDGYGIFIHNKNPERRN